MHSFADYFVVIFVGVLGLMAFYQTFAYKSKYHLRVWRRT